MKAVVGQATMQEMIINTFYYNVVVITNLKVLQCQLYSISIHLPIIRFNLSLFFQYRNHRPFIIKCSGYKSLRCCNANFIPSAY